MVMGGVAQTSPLLLVLVRCPHALVTTDTPPAAGPRPRSYCMVAAFMTL
jgi:hypothetical protein